MTGDSIRGRVVAVWSKEPARGGVLGNVRVEQLGRRAFLVGEVVDDGTGPADPRVGTTYWFPVDDVFMLIEFADVESARAFYAARERATKETAAAAEAAKKPRWRFWG